MQNIFFFFSLQFRFHLPFYRQSSQVRSQVKTKHITNVRLLIQLLAVSFQRSVCMFTKLTSLHLLQSTSITNTGLESPIYASYGGRRKKGEKKKTSSASMKIIGKKSSRSIASSQQHYVCMLIIISTLTKFPIFSPNTFAEQMPDLNCSPQMYMYL